jgi:hypothetical protein
MPRLRRCGRTVIDSRGVAVRLSNGCAGYAGLAICGSVWCCPVCNAKIMARRAVEIGAAVGLWQSQGRPVAFMTFTMRHHRGQALTTLWEALSAAWKATTGGAPWVRAKARHGVAGWLRAVEVTHGPNGWHVHVHLLLFLDGPTDVAELHRSMFDRWRSALVKRGLSAPLAIAQDARLIDGPGDALADYFTKATDQGHRIGLEFTQTQTKAARTRHSTRTPWGLLDDVEHLGDADSLDAWHEWERGSKGKRQLTWSKGLRQMLGLLVEKTDEDVAAEVVGTADDDLLRITHDGWKDLRRTPVLLAQVLTVTERSGLSGLRVQLDAWGITYTLADHEREAA